MRYTSGTLRINVNDVYQSLRQIDNKHAYTLLKWLDNVKLSIEAYWINGRKLPSVRISKVDENKYKLLMFIPKSLYTKMDEIRNLCIFFVSKIYMIEKNNLPIYAKSYEQNIILDVLNFKLFRNLWKEIKFPRYFFEYLMTYKKPFPTKIENIKEFVEKREFEIKKLRTYVTKVKNYAFKFITKIQAADDAIFEAEKFKSVKPVWTEQNHHSALSCGDRRKRMVICEVP